MFVTVRVSSEILAGSCHVTWPLPNTTANTIAKAARIVVYIGLTRADPQPHISSPSLGNNSMTHVS